MRVIADYPSPIDGNSWKRGPLPHRLVSPPFRPEKDLSRQTSNNKITDPIYNGIQGSHPRSARKEILPGHQVNILLQIKISNPSAIFDRITGLT
jgi:hypothetical protein